MNLIARERPQGSPDSCFPVALGPMLDYHSSWFIGGLRVLSKPIIRKIYGRPRLV